MTAARRILTSLAAASLLVVLVLGSPIALLSWGRPEELRRLPGALTAPDDGSLLLGLLTLVGWAAWLVFTLAVALEGVNLAAGRAGRRRFRIPGLRPVQGIAAGLLVASLALLAPVSRDHGPATAPAPVTTSVSVESQAPGAGRTTDPIPHPARQPAAGGTDHLVTPTDSLWSLARQWYGDPTEWRRIAAANPDIDPAVLEVGSTIRVPAHARPAAPVDARPAAPGDAATDPPRVTVAPGDTLSGLAATHLGDPDRWPEIHRLNRSLIDDPDEIDVGWVLTLPGSRPHQGRAAAPVPAPHVPRGLPSVPDSPASSAPEDGGTRPTAPATAPAAETAPATGTAPTAGTGAADSQEQTGSRAADAADAAEGRDAALRTVLAGLSLFLAGAVSGALLAGRRSQLFSRPLGRRVPPLDEEAASLHAALADAVDEEPEGPDPDDLPMATVVLGEDDGPVLLDLAETDGWLGVAGSPEDVEAMIGGIALSLTCTRWSQGLEVVAAGPALAWLAGTGREGVLLAEHRDAMVGADALLAVPRAVPDELPPVERVIVTDTVPDWLPDPVQLRRAGVVVVSPAGPGSAPRTLVRVVSPEEARLGSRSFTPQLVSGPVRRGIVTLVEATGTERTEPAPWWADGDGEGQAGPVGHPPRAPVETPGPAPNSPGLKSPEPTPTRLSRTPPDAPPADEEADVSPSTVAEAPALRVLGPVELLGARGERPTRAVGQCLEYCAWILAHPGCGSAQMRSALMVSEPTRRSNTSRLRRWLGRDEAGRAYLPDAYDGEIRMSDAVGTDWEKVQVMLVGGVSRSPERSLRAVLDLVRGAPLADAAPGQWHWAEEWRTEMVQTVRDVGVELARRARAAGDLRTARFALDRALVCCPEDEELLCEKIRIAHLAGDRSEVERLVFVLTRLARRLGVDLAEETVVLLQEVMEGQARARVV